MTAHPTLSPLVESMASARKGFRTKRVGRFMEGWGGATAAQPATPDLTWPGHGSTLHHLPQGWGRALVAAIWSSQEEGGPPGCRPPFLSTSIPLIVCSPARPESGRLVPTSPARGLRPPIAGLPSPFATPRVRACCEVVCRHNARHCGYAAVEWSASTWRIQGWFKDPLGITAGTITQRFSKAAADKSPGDGTWTSTVGSYHRSCAEQIAKAGGFVAKYMGDGVLAGGSHVGLHQSVY
jgi:hypothetical protein